MIPTVSTVHQILQSLLTSVGKVFKRLKVFCGVSCMTPQLRCPIIAASCDERWRGDATRKAGQRHVLLGRCLAAKAVAGLSAGSRDSQTASTFCLSSFGLSTVQTSVSWLTSGLHSAHFYFSNKLRGQRWSLPCYFGRYIETRAFWALAANRALRDRPGCSEPLGIAT